MMVARTLALLLVGNVATGLQITTPPNAWTARRNFFQTVAAGTISSSVVLAGGSSAQAAEEILVASNEPASAVIPPKEFRIYEVLADSSEALNPTLDSVEMSSFLQKISPQQGGALWLGEHHNSMRDHKVQAKLLRDLHGERSKLGTKVAVGFEQIQIQFQPVLDRFVAGELSLEELRLLVQWDKRWVWPFEVYQDIFATAQELGIPLVALNVNSEDLYLVEQGGLPALPQATLLDYIQDPKGFAQFLAGSRFDAYVDYVIRPSYDLHLALGLLNKSNTMSGEGIPQAMPFRNFLSGRILWDETMANRAYSWTKNNPGGLLVGLVGADHVKFGNGIPARYARMAAGNNKSSISVMLNPTLTDSRPTGSVIGVPGVGGSSRPDQVITLQLRYLKDGVDPNSAERFLPSSTGGVLPLADYLIFG